MPPGATYEPIATASPSGTNTVTFSSISGSYTDLRLVISVLSSAASANNVQMIFNNDTANNYSDTFLYGTGTTATSIRETSVSRIIIVGGLSGFTDTIPAMSVVDIFSYAGSTNKTCLVNEANDRNGSGAVARQVGLWRSTAAITSIKLTTANNNFASGTTITLYGIKNSA